MDPLMMALHREVLKREAENLDRIQTETDSDLIINIGKSSSSDQVDEVNLTPQDVHFSPVLTLKKTNTLGSLSSKSLEAETPQDGLSTSSCIISPSCSTTSCFSTSQSISSPPLFKDIHEEGNSVSSCSISLGLSSFSSSYTSWTQPLVGKQLSDSCVPSSSILDMAEEILEGEIKNRSSPRLSSPKYRSANTSKDISEIDDFELDMLEDQFDIELPEDEEDTKEDTWLVVSPDLAYGSLGPSNNSGDLKLGS